MVILSVAYTSYEEDREEIIRVVSARKATPRERRIYACLLRDERPRIIRVHSRKFAAKKICFLSGLKADH